MDGGTTEYFGLGYKVIDFHSLAGFDDVKIGTWAMQYEDFEEEMKYFYSNYKNYYYLPEEDTAIHKSVASYVDKARRVQATAKNCYTRKLSSYLPQWDILFQPFFKRKYEDRDIFFELTEEMKTERSLFSRYAGHVVNMIAGSYKQT